VHIYLARELQRIHSGVIHAPKAGEINQHSYIRVPPSCLLSTGVYWYECLTSAPVELNVVVATEGEHHGCHAGLSALAHVVKVKHALHSPVLVDNSILSSIHSMSHVATGTFCQLHSTAACLNTLSLVQ
jgi:hypothetical protein